LQRDVNSIFVDFGAGNIVPRYSGDIPVIASMRSVMEDKDNSQYGQHYYCGVNGCEDVDGNGFSSAVTLC
jgi:hypothetical protein